MEVEAKFSIPDEKTFQRLLEATCLAGYSLKEPVLLHLHDQYLDTAGGTFLAGGYACRIRQQNDLTFATLKGLGTASGAIHRRMEHEVELSQPLAPAHWPPSEARDLALRLGGDQPLVPLFEAEQIRHRCHLYDGDQLVAELNLDRVRLFRESQSAASYLELEVELSHGGSEEILERLGEELQSEWRLPPQNRSKFERGLALFSPPPTSRQARATAIEVIAPDSETMREPPPAELLSAPGIDPDDPMSEAGRKTLHFHYQRMVYHEAGTRTGRDIESLHDMRVATRRMRAAFRVFGKYYEPKIVAPYLKGLRRTGRALGPVRDLDVFRIRVDAYLSTLPPLQQHDLDEFLIFLEARRDLSRRAMNTYLDSAKYARFKDRFGQFVESEGMGSQRLAFDGDEPPAYRVRHVAPVVIYRRLASVRAYDEWVSIPSPPPERLHSLRIACKRLRYTLEFFREILGPDTKVLIKSLVAIQDHLGNLQDAVVACALLNDTLRQGTLGHEPAASDQAGLPVEAPGVERYLAATRDELQRLLASFPEVWQPLQEEQFSKMVARAVAGL